MKISKRIAAAAATCLISQELVDSSIIETSNAFFYDLKLLNMNEYVCSVAE